MPPNILWIVTTQWRAQACGYALDPNARTPALDALARRGVDFSQAVTPHPFGPFARAALLTGLPSPANGVRDYFDPLPAAARTIAHAMGERSYGTAFFGKWHLYRREPSAPLTGEEHARIVVPPEFRGGFGLWEGFESGFQLNDPWLHGSRLPEPVRFDGYQSDVVCERAAAALRGMGGPWFAVVSLEAPHPPYHAPAAGIRDPDTGRIALRINVPRGEVAERARRELSGYYDHIEATDRSVGRLVASLPEETIIVFTSAHGDMHGSHGTFRKGWPYEESVRVPLLVRGAGENRRDGRPVSLLDLPAMTLAWAGGVPLRAGAAILGGAAGPAQISMPSVVHLPDQCDRVWSGVRSPTRKLILGADRVPWLFFDLENDPFEMQNLAPDPAFAAEIRALAESVS
jgi:arylsulfatase A-like enzyme